MSQQKAYCALTIYAYSSVFDLAFNWCHGHWCCWETNYVWSIAVSLFSFYVQSHDQGNLSLDHKILSFENCLGESIN